MDTENKEQSLFHQEPESDPRPLTGDDDVVALDNTAFKDNQWKAEFVISVFNKLEAEKLREKANKLLTFLGIDPNSVIMNRIGERSKFFFAEPQENVEAAKLQVEEAEPPVAADQQKKNELDESLNTFYQYQIEYA